MKSFFLIYLVAISLLTNFLFQDNELEKSMKRGKAIYADFCVTCHLTEGEGVKNAFPPLAKSDYLKKNREESIKGIKYGQKGELTVNGVQYNGLMPSMGLEDEEIADVMNYILNSWGNKSDKLVTPEEVSLITKK
ncbi:c-type cytochrome [Cellulophaga tyrosinoxydans]|uniref:Cytochrome c n=1 Tax=Cellulophaga tyrosinoxydans TaxID=504486 RepID=A0A1W2ABH9_9FLAO|nr:cytochrome c [Cellulophaga tyrosinoxydans]SMC57811.1 Cytochrome c [Cellulophaga tyrosinoxydans]|tara:strand:- start:989 stop:1393 length:405 start_codon:yes stop_codon:yes gene_type:complete